MKLRKKQDIDAELAAELGLSTKEVRDITRAFLERVREHLADREEVHLDGFGKFHLAEMKGLTLTTLTDTPRGHPKRKRVVRVHRKFRVHFAKADAFNRRLREKYGPGSEKK